MAALRRGLAVIRRPTPIDGPGPAWSFFGRGASSCKSARRLTAKLESNTDPATRSVNRCIYSRVQTSDWVNVTCH